MRPTVLILGGGIAGLSAAMELAEDCDVTVVERRAIVGGKARTWTDKDFGVFREHSFRVFHDSYHNVFDLMRRVPHGNGGRTVFDNMRPFLSREKLFESYPKTWEMYRSRGAELSLRDKLLNGRDILRLLGALSSSEERLSEQLRDLPFEELFALRGDGSRGLVFEVLRAMSQVEYSADRLNPDLRIMLAFIEKHFLHGAPGTGWNALCGPTSDSFIEPWRAHLEARGVRFRDGTEVTGIHVHADRQRIESVELRDLESDRVSEQRADQFVCALTSDVLLELASDDLMGAVPALEALAGFRRVANNGALIFTSRPQEPLGGYYMWHPWRVAVTPYLPRWSKDYEIARYGRGEASGRIQDILSYVICDWEEPGVHIPKPARQCSPEEIYAELCHMGTTDRSVITNFDPADHVLLDDEQGGRTHCLIDEALIYDEACQEIVRNEDTLVHIPAGGYYDMPGADTPLANLSLAGCHCFNDFACGDNMEGANETGRRAARSVIAKARGRREVTVFEGRRDSRAVKAFEALRAVDRRIYGWLPRRPRTARSAAPGAPA